ncbi:MAG: hypothetical protein M3Y45_04705 [Actinomycetota bacterium]|nr:hypothetical protein [Actinomycetota bacterium]
MVNRVDHGGATAAPGRSGALLLMLLVFVLAGFFCPGTSAADQREAATELARKHSPVMMLREQEDPLCGTDGEQYQPMAVDAIFGNPDVRLMVNRADGSVDVVKRSPSRSDVAAASEEHFIDLKGEPLGDTCVYSKDFDALKRSGQVPVSVYANIAREPGKRGIALQYWFFWYFNQFNDLHEGDWEGMQITFDAETPEEALGTEPGEMILFQHAGGERANWTDSKVQKEGTHPVVYPAAGSHATFYMPAIFVQNGSRGSGVGCDITSEPLRRVDPRPILLPEEPPDGGSFSWLSFDGRWGQKEKGFNNGPTGPQTKTQWSQPFTWMSEQRWSSPRMPGGSIVGPQATNAFCGVIVEATGLLNLQQADPLSAYLILIGLIGAAVLLFGVTTWRASGTDALRARRAYGQIVRAAIRLYRSHWKVLAVLAAVAIPIVGGTQGLAGDLSDTSTGNGITLAFADIVISLGRPIATAIVAATVIVFIRNLMEGHRNAGVRASFLGTKARFWRVVTAQIAATLGVILMAITVIGIPFAIRYLVAWSFVQQEVLMTDKSIRESFRGSVDLVRGRWWHALRTIAPLQMLAVILGPTLGLVMIFTSLPLPLVNLISSLVYALMIPFTAIGTTLLYFDLQVRQETEPVTGKSRLPWRQAPDPAS